VEAERKQDPKVREVRTTKVEWYEKEFEFINFLQIMTIVYYEAILDSD
ncbi:MAG: hypothetical protein RLZZ386_1618, partial [Planctomycetota bacterium]